MKYIQNAMYTLWAPEYMNYHTHSIHMDYHRHSTHSGHKCSHHIKMYVLWNVEPGFCHEMFNMDQCIVHTQVCMQVSQAFIHTKHYWVYPQRHSVYRTARVVMETLDCPTLWKYLPTFLSFLASRRRLLVDCLPLVTPCVTMGACMKKVASESTEISCCRDFWETGRDLWTRCGRLSMAIRLSVGSWRWCDRTSLTPDTTLFMDCSMMGDRSIMFWLPRELTLELTRDLTRLLLTVTSESESKSVGTDTMEHSA